MKPRISVVMPVYNTRRYLSSAIESILSQSYEDFEFLIFDDGSTDGSLELIEQYQQSDPRIRLWSERLALLYFRWYDAEKYLSYSEGIN